MSKTINNENNNETADQSRKAHFIQFSSILAGYILMIDIGVHGSWTSSALPHLKSAVSEIPITFEQSAWLASIDNITAVLGNIMFSFILNGIGRKYTFLIFGFLQLVPWILINIATNYLYLCMARIILGIGYGGSLCFFCIYIGEIADKSVRGMFLALERTCFNLGGLLVNTAAVFLPYKTMNLVAILIPLLALGAFPFTLETPYFYLLKKRDDDAVKTLMKLSGISEPKLVMSDIQRMKISIEQCRNSQRNTILELFIDKGSRRAIFILFIVNITYSFSGFFVIQSYAQEIFEQTGSSITSAYSAMIISGVQVLVGPFSSLLVDRWGRKPSYLLSGILSAICLAIVGLFFCFKVTGKADVSTISWVPLVALTLFKVTCSIGLSTLPYVYAGELFSIKVKAVAIMITIILSTVCIFVAKFVTPFINRVAGIYTTFFMSACACIVGPFILLYIAPETKGKNLEEVLEIMRVK